MNRGKTRSAHTNLFGTRELAGATRYAVIVAHPDDEVIGAGGLISGLENVTILHVTDGVPGNVHIVEAGLARRSECARARRQECQSALALANVPASRIVEFGIIDHQAARYLPHLTRRVAAFLQQTAPDVVLTHPYEGGHPDHDATAFATHIALRLLRRNGFQPPAVFEIALHPASDGKKRVLDFLPGEGAEITTLMLDKKACELKRRMFECLTTQPEALRSSSVGPERFRRPPPYNFALPPNGGNLNYQASEAVVSGAEWQLLVKEAWSDLFPEEASSH